MSRSIVLWYTLSCTLTLLRISVDASILENILKDPEEKRAKDMSQCVRYLVESRFFSVSIFPQTSGHVTQRIIDVLSSRVPLQVFSNWSSLEINRDKHTDTKSNKLEKAPGAIVILNDELNLHETLNRTKKFCRPRARYILCFTEPKSSREMIIELGNTAMLQAWKYKLMKVTILAFLDNSVQLIDSVDRNSKSFCTPAKPEILSEWRNESFTRNVELFRKPRYNGCKIRLFFFPCPPYADFGKNPATGETSSYGFEIELAHRLLETLNLTPDETPLNILLFPQITKMPSWTTVITGVGKGARDLGLCGYTLDEYPKLETSRYYGTEKIVWLVPLSNSKLPWYNIVKPFRWEVWLGVGISVMFVNLFKIILASKMSILGLLGFFLGISSERLDRSYEKIYIIAWVLFGYIVTQAYLASLAGILTKQNNQQLETMEDLARSDLQIVGLSKFRDLLAKDGDPIQRQLYDRFRTIEEYEMMLLLKDLQNGIASSQIALAIGREMIVERNGTHVMAESIADRPLVFLVTEGSPFLEDIDRRLIQMQEAGLISRFFEKDAKGGTRHNVDSAAPIKMKMEHLVGMYTLLAFGLFISCFAFFLELAFYRGNDTFEGSSSANSF